MDDNKLSEPSRELVWERVKRSAQKHHEHPGERGIMKLIAIDAKTSAQYVSDWKSLRSPIPMAKLTALADLYGVSVSYLSGFSSDPNQGAPQDTPELNIIMAALVERAIEKSSEPVDAKKATQLCATAIKMLSNGDNHAYILGTLINEAENHDC
ncbi:MULTISPECIES: hypothetical protein [unclassified Halomonas]|uniref:hypothetical protein n=1 Tax=unclassified Halomonas TaxID=2609666 RepID=UPI00209DDFAA|nr:MULTISPECIES: hypothetical protein [unclassified Halomonas]MCP1313005.1 hypothetical protein [Halomonas sp. 707D7]MCP1326095.1 hypothetical protein [Halomonas sp. 707D4]